MATRNCKRDFRLPELNKLQCVNIILTMCYNWPTRWWTKRHVSGDRAVGLTSFAEHSKAGVLFEPRTLGMKAGEEVYVQMTTGDNDQAETNNCRTTIDGGIWHPC